MKAVLDLTKAITDKRYYKEQFEGQGTDKNILSFVDSCQNYNCFIQSTVSPFLK
jgi:hypothetical protein